MAVFEESGEIKVKQIENMAVHGGEVFRLAAEAGIEPEKIIDFSANINPFGLPPGVFMAMRKSLDNLANYPEIGAQSLSRSVAWRHNLNLENVVVGNGSSALIYLLARVLKPQKALIWEPTFTEYERALRQSNSQVINLPSWDPEKKILLEDLLEATVDAQPDLVFLCNPNNPTGALWSLAELECIVSEFKKAKIICVLDEAFIDFVGAEFSFAARVNDFDNLIVLRSLTKIYALAGLRCGYLLCGPSLNRHISDSLEPWSLNSVAIAAAIVALENDHDFINKTIAFVKKECDYLYQELQKIGFLRPFPAHANYILAKLENHVNGPQSGVELRQYLFAKESILIRLCGDYRGLDQNFLRFAVKGEAENRRLIKTLKNYQAVG